MPDDRARTAAHGAAQTSAHPAPARGSVALSTLWFGLFGGPIAWSVQTLVNLAVASHLCFPKLYPLSSPITAGLRGIVFAVSLATLAICIAAAAASWRAWLYTREEHQGGSGGARQHGTGPALLETGEGRTRFMALSGVLLSITFFILSAAHMASIFLVTPCGI